MMRRSGVALAAQAGLVDVTMVAVDGTTMAGDASLSRNVDAGELRARFKQWAEQVEANDTVEDADDTTGPIEEMSDPESMRAWIREHLHGVDTSDSPADDPSATVSDDSAGGEGRVNVTEIVLDSDAPDGHEWRLLAEVPAARPGIFKRIKRLIGASVMVDGTQFGGATDANGGAGSYVITVNEEDPPVFAVEREALLAGRRARTVGVRLPSMPNSIRFQIITPAAPDGPSGPPAGAPVIIMRMRDTEVHDLLEVPGDFLEMWLFDVDWSEPAATLTRAADIGVADFDLTLCPDYVFGWDGCFAQPGTVQTLMALEEIMMHRLQYYRHETYESLIGNFVVDVDGMDHGGIRWFELRRESGGDWGLYQEGTYSLDGDNRWMGSIASDRDGNIALGHTVTSSTTYPSIRYTGRLPDDRPGIMTQPETSIVAGQGSSPMSRWGDYAAMSLDPSDDCTFWFTNEYVGGDRRWRTQIASFRFETCGCVEMPPPPSLEAQVNADNRIDLFWDDSSDGTVVEYRVERSRTAGGPYEVLDVVPDSSPGIAGGPGYSFQDTDVPPLTHTYQLAYVVLGVPGSMSCTPGTASGGTSSAQATIPSPVPP